MAICGIPGPLSQWLVWGSQSLAQATLEGRGSADPEKSRLGQGADRFLLLSPARLQAWLPGTAVPRKSPLRHVRYTVPRHCPPGLGQRPLGHPCAPECQHLTQGPEPAAGWRNVPCWSRAQATWLRDGGWSISSRTRCEGPLDPFPCVRALCPPRPGSLIVEWQRGGEGLDEYVGGEFHQPQDPTSHPQADGRTGRPPVTMEGWPGNSYTHAGVQAGRCGMKCGCSGGRQPGP